MAISSIDGLAQFLEHTHKGEAEAQAQAQAQAQANTPGSAGAGASAQGASDDPAREACTALLAAEGFWSRLKSKNSKVRCAMYELLGVVCRLAPEYVEPPEVLTVLAPLMFNSLAERDLRCQVKH